MATSGDFGFGLPGHEQYEPVTLRGGPGAPARFVPRVFPDNVFPDNVDAEGRRPVPEVIDLVEQEPSRRPPATPRPAGVKLFKILFRVGESTVFF